MTKAQLVKEWQEAAEKKIPGGLSLEKHNILLETLSDVISAELLNTGGEISLPGLGKLKTVRQGSRKVRNPRTGQVINVPSHNKVKFLPGKDFADALKQ